MFAHCVDLRITKIDQAVCQLQLRVVATMTGTCCLVCGNSQSKDSDASFHRFPSDLGRRAIWLRVFDFQESDIKPHHRVCSRHFPNIATLGKRFVSPIKKGPRAKRAKGRQTKKQLSELYSSVSPTPSSSRSVTPSTFEQPSLLPWFTLYLGNRKFNCDRSKSQVRSGRRR